MKRSLLLSMFAVAIVAMSLGQAMATITLSLNLRYTDPASVAAGGTWDLLARTTDPNGISGLQVVLDGITFGATTLNSGIGAIPIETRQSGSIVEFVYGQDVNAVLGTSKFVGVGTGTGPGNVAKDDLFLGSPNPYDNYAKIASGSFGATRPAFATFPGAGGQDTAGQNWSSGAATAAGTLATIGGTAPNNLVLGGGDGVRGDSVSVDGLKLGDVNRDGNVTGADFATLQANFNGVGGWNQGDFNSTGTVTGADFASLQANFNTSTPSPAFTVVPEPSSVALLLLSLAGLATSRKRS